MHIAPSHHAGAAQLNTSCRPNSLMNQPLEELLAPFTASTAASSPTTCHTFIGPSPYRGSALAGDPAASPPVRCSAPKAFGYSP